MRKTLIFAGAVSATLFVVGGTVRDRWDVFGSFGVADGEAPDPAYWCRESHFTEGLAKYGDPKTAWNECVVLYLKDCGVTDEEIRTFREIMLEER